MDKRERERGDQEQGKPQHPPILEFLGRINVRQLSPTPEGRVHMAGFDPEDHRSRTEIETSVQDLHSAKEWVRAGNPIPEHLKPDLIDANLHHIGVRFSLPRFSPTTS